LARPGGNITGFINYEGSIAGKWLDLLKEIDPRVVRAAGLFNPDAAPGGGSFFLRPFEAAARSLAITPLATPVRSDADLEAAIAALGRELGGGLVMMADSFMGRPLEPTIVICCRQTKATRLPLRVVCHEHRLYDAAQLYER
jgi:putative ABC transport system substrate-binding protein